VSSYRRTGLDSRSLAGVAVFGALSIVLTLISQALGLNFPIVTYLQFDLGEIAILLAFFIFGPVPALIAAFIEFATLLALGVNAAFFGPELKLIAILSSLLGVWIGVVTVRRTKEPTIKKAVGLGSVLGIVIRAAAMTVPNYLLIIFLITVSGTLGAVEGSFKLIGITPTESNVLVLVLIMTAVFNALQFAFVSAVTYGIVSLPQVQNTRAAGRKPWIATYLQKRDPRVT
jgi:riboflavin transporter FmnP